jgi:hypothetical protein
VSIQSKQTILEPCATMPERMDGAERIAALMDGRLSPADRDALLRDIAASPELLELLADATAAATAVEPVPGDATAARSVWSRQRNWLMAATVLVVVGGITIRTALDQPDDRAIAATIATSEPSLSNEGRPWSAQRGAPVGVSADGRSVRAGVVLFDLEVATRRNDPRRQDLADELATLISDLPASGPVVGRLSLLPDDAARGTAWLDETRRGVESLLNFRMVNVGLHAEALLLSLRAADNSLIENAARSLDEALRDALPDSLTAALRETLTRARDGQASPTSIESGVRDLLTAIAR